MNLIFFDLETTGINVEKDEIIQIGALAYDLTHKRDLSAFEQKIFPSDAGKANLAKMREEGFENCYNEEVWEKTASAPGIGYNRFAAWVRRYADNKKMSKQLRPYYVAQGCGYNAAKFDNPFIFNQCQKYSVFLPMAMQCWDTLQLALWTFYARQIVSKDMKLATVADVLGVKLDNAHDARADVIATKEITLKLLEMIQPEDNFA